MTLAMIVALRVLVMLFCVATAGYGVLNCSSFAFDMFVRPQLLPWLTHFVSWHHLWLVGAYVASLASLFPRFARGESAAGRETLARRLAIGYAAVFGVVTAWQLASPHLPTLWNDHRALPTVLAALAPLFWLSAIDHLSVPGSTVARENAAWRPPGQRRLLVACAVAAGHVWGAHVGRALARSGSSASAQIDLWLVTSLWTLALTLGIFALVYSSACLIASLASATRAPRTIERVLVVVAAAGAICELLRRIVLPTLSLSAVDSWTASAAVGAALAVSCSGLARLRMRAVATESVRSDRRRATAAAAAAAIIPLLSFVPLGYVERIDWAFVGQRLVVVSAWTLTFLFVLRATRTIVDRSWSARGVLFPPLAILLVLVGVPRGAVTVAAWTGNGRLEPTVTFDRYAGADVAFQLVSDVFVARAGFDADSDYYRYLDVHGNFSGATTVVVPSVDFSRSSTRAHSRRPDVYIFAVDSLRRDYLEPYNAGVWFTPEIAEFARDSFVFRNAFTRHGGTELAIPSIWAGMMLVRQVRTRGFERVNAFEKLVRAEGYRVFINDFTIAQNLSPATPVTHVNPGVLSADTDLCANLSELQTRLDDSKADARPVFGFFAPMNVHILNTYRGGQRSLDAEYPGFHAPYASRLRRIDRCFGEFIDYLKKRNRYDDSIIVVTSDHGDSLGENGRWGHATWLSPEVVRIPLIVKIPKTDVETLTTDLARIAFSTDVAPTLYSLLGYEVRDLGPQFGAPLFVPAHEGLPGRRGRHFLLRASYGKTYALLSQNGSQLYVSDLAEHRDFAYDLSRGVVGVETDITPDLRSFSQREIRAQVGDLSKFFQVKR